MSKTIYKYYINIRRPGSVEHTRIMKSFVQPFIDRDEIGVNGLYSYLTENDTCIVGGRKNCFFFKTEEHALDFLRVIPKEFWVFPMLGLNEKSEYIQGWQDLETRIFFTPEYLKLVNDRLGKKDE